MSGSSAIGAGGSTYGGGYRTDRAAAIARSAAAAAQASGATAQAMSAKDFGEVFDQADLDLLNAAQSSVALGRGGGRLIGVVAGSQNGPPVELSGAAATLYIQTHRDQLQSAKPAAQARQPIAMFDALNVDFVTTNIDKTPSRNMADYAEYVKKEVADLQAKFDKVVFVGASGSGRVTHNVDEYVDWLNEAATKRAATMAKGGVAG